MAQRYIILTLLLVGILLLVCQSDPFTALDWALGLVSRGRFFVGAWLSTLLWERKDRVNLYYYTLYYFRRTDKANGKLSSRIDPVNQKLCWNLWFPAGTVSLLQGVLRVTFLNIWWHYLKKKKNVNVIQSHLIMQMTISFSSQGTSVIFWAVIIPHVDCIYLWAVLTGRCAFIHVWRWWLNGGKYVTVSLMELIASLIHFQ